MYYSEAYKHASDAEQSDQAGCFSSLMSKLGLGKSNSEDVASPIDKSNYNNTYGFTVTDVSSKTRYSIKRESRVATPQVYTITQPKTEIDEKLEFWGSYGTYSSHNRITADDGSKSGFAKYVDICIERLRNLKGRLIQVNLSDADTDFLLSRDSQRPPIQPRNPKTELQDLEITNEEINARFRDITSKVTKMLYFSSIINKLKQEDTNGWEKWGKVSKEALRKKKSSGGELSRKAMTSFSMRGVQGAGSKRVIKVAPVSY